MSASRIPKSCAVRRVSPKRAHAALPARSADDTKFIIEARQRCRCLILNTAAGQWLAEALRRLERSSHAKA